MVLLKEKPRGLAARGTSCTHLHAFSGDKRTGFSKGLHDMKQRYSLFFSDYFYIFSRQVQVSGGFMLSAKVSS